MRGEFTGGQPVPSAANTHGVSLRVDPRDPGLLELRPQIVPGNVDDA